MNFEVKKCPTCGRKELYRSSLNKGIATIVQAFANYVAIKGINIVNIAQEMVVAKELMGPAERMQSGKITHSQHNNLSHARCHGMIAKLDKQNNYCLTKKGASFLRGDAVNKIAIIEHGRNCGYALDEDGKPITCTIHELRENDDPFWNGINYDVEQGEVIYSTK